MCKIICRYSISFVVLFCTVACYHLPVVEIKEYPLMPIDLFAQQGSVQLRRVPMHTDDRKYRAITYTSDGEINAVNLETALFPTDIYVIYLDGMEAPQVFLGRSPKSGCIMIFDDKENMLRDPCQGSTFALDGSYIAGPAEQDLDRLPSQVRDNMLWVRNEIIYGAEKSATSAN
jgi:hypothetical protein